MSRKALTEEDMAVANIWKGIEFESIEKTEEPGLKIELKGEIFKEAKFGIKEVTIFAPAFWEKYLSGISRIRTSYGTYPDLVGTKVVSRPLGPIGYKISTHVLRLICSKSHLEERLSALPNTEKIEKLLVSAVITFQQAFKKAVSVILHCELGDFDCYWNMDGENVYFYVYDTFEGGSGITKRVFEDWTGAQRVLENIKQTLSMNCCSDYCERCLILPRTPEFYLRKGLLNKQIGRVFV